MSDGEFLVVVGIACFIVGVLVERTFQDFKRIKNAIKHK